MEIKMPDGAVLVTENPEVIDSYINMMGRKEDTKKQTTKKSATKVAAASESEYKKGDTS